METNSSNPPKRSPARKFFRWLFLVVGAVAVFVTGYEIVMSLAFGVTHVIMSRTEGIVFTLIHIIAAVFVLVIVSSMVNQLVRRMAWLKRFRDAPFIWRGARRTLVGLAILLTLIATFYAEENWRGKRAWEECKRELEAKGEVLDWSAYVPEPIPDDQNIIKAPKMTAWFVKPSPSAKLTNELGSKMMPDTLFKFDGTNKSRPPVLIARVMAVAPSSRATNGSEVVVRFGASGEPERLAKLVQATVGLSVNAPQGIFMLTQHPLGKIEPVRIALQTDQRLSVADLSPLFPPGLISSNVGLVTVEADADANSFRVVLTPKATISAEEYLVFTDALAPEFELIREALKRPLIRMDGDFERPFGMPIVNYVFMRSLAQTLAARAQCCLLLGKSEQAVRELSLILETRRFLTTKPTTLVAAMIDVAICGLYVETIAEGFRMQAWRESEVIALQQQLQRINLPPAVADSFRGERAAVCQTFEVLSANEFVAMFSSADRKKGWLEKLTNPGYLLLRFAPRGWVYQNFATFAPMEQTAIEIFSSDAQLIDARQAEKGVRDIETISQPWNPYTILARIALPNYTRAAQVLARNQTRVNQALIACGLWRYRHAHGNYPETLDALVPQFIERLPRDLIGGQPLRYRRTSDGQFDLYSVGWNETDDGGQIAEAKGPSVDFGKGDWVWQTAAK